MHIRWIVLFSIKCHHRLQRNWACVCYEFPIIYRATLCVSTVYAVGRCPSVRPSVCLSVTLMYCIQTAEDIVKLLYRPGSTFSFFSFWTPIPNSKGTPSAGRKIHRGGIFFSDFRLKSPFISETVQDRSIVTIER